MTALLQYLRDGFSTVVEGVRHSAQVLRPRQLDDADFRRVVDAMPLGVTIKDAEGHILYSNPADAALHGYQERGLLGKPAGMLGAPAARRTGATPPEGAWLRGSWNARSSGEMFPVQLRSNVVRNRSGTVLGVVTTCEDLTEREEAIGETIRRGLEDPLTGLANRTFLIELVNRAVARLVRHPDYRFAVLYLNLRHFRAINETLGHDRGDLVLLASAKGLREVIRPTDVAARIAGDEFAILLDGLGELTDATRVAERIAARFEVPLKLEEQEVQVTVCVGIAVSQADGRNAAQYLKEARVAMNRARAEERLFEVFDPVIHRRAVERLQMETDLRTVVERQQLHVVYQPIVDLQTGRVTGFEALARWNHPERGAIGPADFIPVAEDTGLVVPIGSWVLRTACAQLAEWRSQFPNRGDLSVNVNISVQQLRRPDIVEQVSATLRETGLPAECLKLEVTESTLMEDADTQMAILHRLRAAGVGVTIDDFGTGYSSLSYLQRSPIDALKIDRSFIVRERGDSWDIVRMIIALARDKRALAVAEGVETEDQAQELRDMGCDRAQGFLYAEPLPPPLAARMLEV